METLKAVAAPYAVFTPASPAQSMIWQQGAAMRFSLRIFGLLPLGEHKIFVQTFDSTRHIIQTCETNRMVPVWKHTIRLEPITAHTTRYTDELEIGAGRLSGLVVLWGKAFYRHRQRKWIRLLT